MLGILSHDVWSLTSVETNFATAEGPGAAETMWTNMSVVLLKKKKKSLILSFIYWNL